MFKINSDQIDDMIKTQSEDVISVLEVIGGHLIPLGITINYIDNSVPRNIETQKQLNSWISELRNIYQ